MPSLMRQWFEDHLCARPPPTCRLSCCGSGLREKGQGPGWLSCPPHAPRSAFPCGLKLLTSSSSEQECLHGIAPSCLPPQSLRLGKNLDLRKWGHPFPKELLPVSCLPENDCPHHTTCCDCTRGSECCRLSRELWLPFPWAQCWPSPGQCVGPVGAGSCRHLDQRRSAACRCWVHLCALWMLHPDQPRAQQLRTQKPLEEEGAGPPGKGGKCGR